ncbi:PIN domain-containing protein [Halovivax ruber]|uniref:PIN domain-containing protein n=1 Tax=Halovivax ruber TaxID=387341 RepID=UPI0011E4E805|nr:PIN domain-containing protein [Halovivax ruber]
MSDVVLDSNAVIMHGRAFGERVRNAPETMTLVLPHAVKRELVDDVLAKESAPNHRESARTIQRCIDEGYLAVREPDYERYSALIDEASRRIADESLPEHEVKADRYIPALCCDLATKNTVRLVTADRKLRRIVRDMFDRYDPPHSLEIEQPRTVLTDTG